MDEIKFKVAELLTALKANREAHRAEFEKAMSGYEVEATEQLQAMIEKVKAGKRPNVYITLAMPQDHTKDYDRVIRMLEMSVEDTLVLSEHEFAMYVQDDWQWKGQFTTTNSVYLAKAR